MKVLVVDDSLAMRMIVIKTAKKAGLSADFIQASDGAEGLEAIRQHQPDLVLSDWNMPNMTGIEMLEAVKEERLEVKFGFVTTEATNDMRLRARKAGALFLIAKPFTVESFEQALWVIED